MGKVVALILARGGSKGIPRKNIKLFCGKPLIAWTIIQALGTPEIDEVYVSSDSEEILKVAENYGARTINRPDEISDDSARSESAVLHALERLGDEQEIVLMLEPTAPLRRRSDLSNVIQQFRRESWDSGFSGSVLENFLIWEKDSKGDLNSINHDYRNQIPRQERNRGYVENGAAYIFRPNIFINNRNRFGGKIGIYLMEFWQSFELDIPEDWPFVEMIFNRYLKADYSSM